jgi:hypothetical protein
VTILSFLFPFSGFTLSSCYVHLCKVCEFYWIDRVCIIIASLDSGIVFGVGVGIVITLDFFFNRGLG